MAMQTSPRHLASRLLSPVLQHHCRFQATAKFHQPSATAGAQHRMRGAAMGDVCRLLHAELTLAHSRRAIHRSRRLAAALCHAVCALRRPQLGRAADAHDRHG